MKADIDYEISIDRASSQYAIFKGFEIVFGFTPYTTEADAEYAARAWVSERTDKEPTFIYPRITSMKMTRCRSTKRAAS
uniref:hypothetical protein n=1 Tax=Marinobacterium profundum TaxID=1714300 RepID=UPI00082EEC47|nr:hypothetical protein [Marinobacterium profundum]